MSNKFYITTTLPYVNSDPHIGFAMEIIRADVIARHKKEQGNDVFFNTGTDEHGLKIYQNAVEKKLDPQTYVDGYAQKFKDLKGVLGLSEDIHFIRTTDAHHVAAAQEFWKLCKANGYIYKKDYTVKYCVGCELEKTDSELVDGRCPIHPNRDIENISEENYFFKFSAFGDKLTKLYEERPDFVVPSFRFNEIKAFVARGLDDFSISRLATKMPWGIPVPDDADHVMYVWFDALVNYISTIGWPSDQTSFAVWWNETGGVVQYCGKDNLRQQSAMWQAMLMAAGLNPSKQIVIDGFITSGGQKMSKSLGNVISPFDLVNEFGTDALRFFVTHQLHPFEDSDVTVDKLKEAYNAHLANGIGNLVSRVMRMATTNGVSLDVATMSVPADVQASIEAAYAGYEINRVCDIIWSRIQNADKFIQANEPFKKVKVDLEAGKADIAHLLKELWIIGTLLAPIMPTTSAAVLDCVRGGVMPAAALFLRKA